VSLAEFNDFASAIQAIVASASLIVGGYWVYARFVRQQERFAHIESDADIVVLGRQGGYWIVEIAALLQNKGKVQLEVKDLGFDLNAITDVDDIETDPRWGGQVHFPHNIAKGTFLPEKYSHFFIGPGISARYSWIASVPEAATFLSLHCFFLYADGRAAGHSMEKNVRLPPRDAP
jgi:hypothetical protein